jgi:hypothetical protein
MQGYFWKKWAVTIAHKTGYCSGGNYRVLSRDIFVWHCSSNPVGYVYCWKYCDVWDFHIGAVEDSSLLGCYVVLLGKVFMASWNTLTLEMEVLVQSFETLGTVFPMMKHNITEVTLLLEWWNLKVCGGLTKQNVWRDVGIKAAYRILLEKPEKQPCETHDGERWMILRWILGRWMGLTQDHI